MNVFGHIKKWVFWEFGRNSIPYEIVCAVYIGLLVFLPVGSNGFFNPGDSADIDGTSVMLQREGTKLYFTWEDEKPDISILKTWARDRFGAETVLLDDADLGPRTLRIHPGGWTWRNIWPF